jgi:hypothetical protein
VPPEAGFFLIAWQVDALTLARAETALSDHEDRLEALRQAHGLGADEAWPSGAGPPTYEEARRQRHDAWDALDAAHLDELGEHPMARLFREDRPRFDALSEAGRAFFHGPRQQEGEVGDWLDALLAAVAACVEVQSPTGPLGTRYHEDEGLWEVVVYPTPVELVGGAHDGAVVVPGFTLDLEQLRAAFDAVVSFGWDALGLNDPEGPHVHVEGTFRGREVWLRVLAQAPDDEEPGLKVDATGGPRRPG